MWIFTLRKNDWAASGASRHLAPVPPAREGRAGIATGAQDP